MRMTEDSRRSLQREIRGRVRAKIADRLSSVDKQLWVVRIFNNGFPTPNFKREVLESDAITIDPGQVGLELNGENIDASGQVFSYAGGSAVFGRISIEREMPRQQDLLGSHDVRVTIGSLSGEFTFETNGSGRVTINNFSEINIGEITIQRR